MSELNNTQQVDKFVAEEAPYLEKPVDFCRWLSHDPGIERVKETVKILTHVGHGHPTCTVSVDRKSRIEMISGPGVTMEEFELIEQVMVDAGLRIESRRLQVRDGSIAYTMHMKDDYSVIVSAANSYFGFPLTFCLQEWELEHHELCGIDWPDEDCECERSVAWDKTLVIKTEDAGKWKEVLMPWLMARYDAPDPPDPAEQEAVRRLEEIEKLAPKCAWNLYDSQCNQEQRDARFKYRTLLAEQAIYEQNMGF